MALQSLDNQLCFAIYAAEHAFLRVYKPVLEKLGLTYPQYLVMLVLWEQDDQTVSAIGKRLMLESNTLTPLLKRLETLGFITRTRDKADERQVRVVLTSAGRKLAQNARDVPKCVLKATGLSVESLASLKRDVDAVRASSWPRLNKFECQAAARAPASITSSMSSQMTLSSQARANAIAWSAGTGREIPKPWAKSAEKSETVRISSTLSVPSTCTFMRSPRPSVMMPLSNSWACGEAANPLTKVRSILSLSNGRPERWPSEE